MLTLDLVVWFATSLCAAPCDVKTVVPAAWCAQDRILLESKDLVTDKSYYACPTCKKSYEAPGKCEKCNQELERRTSEKDACPKCFARTDAVDTCQKEFWQCDACKQTAAREGNCEKCKAPLKKHVSLAKIGYVCTGCGFAGDRPGNCPAMGPEECAQAGKPLTKTCSLSGTFPHGGTAKT